MLAGVIDEMGVIEPNDLTARLFTSDSLMASGKVRLIIMSKKCGMLEGVSNNQLWFQTSTLSKVDTYTDEITQYIKMDVIQRKKEVKDLQDFYKRTG